MAVRHGGNAACAARGASVAPCQVRRRPRFIQNDQRRDVPSWLGGLPLTPCGLHAGAILRAGVQRVF